MITKEEIFELYYKFINDAYSVDFGEENIQDRLWYYNGNVEGATEFVNRILQYINSKENKKYMSVNGEVIEGNGNGKDW